MNPEYLIIDKNTIKALSVKSRLSILESLNEKPKTLSMLSEELMLKASTLSQHLKALEESGLVKKEQTDRKWKYYYITKKAQRILSPIETKVVFSLFSGLFLTFYSIYEILKSRIAIRNMSAELNYHNTIEPVGNITKSLDISSFNWPIVLWIGLGIIAITIIYTIYKINIIKKIENKKE